MNRDRYQRPDFARAELDALTDDEARHRLLFDWWCDDADRLAFIASLHGHPFPLPSRTPLELDPAPPLDRPAAQGFRTPPVWLLSHPDDIRAALARPDQFSNLPYAELGGGSFLLAQDPPRAHGAQVDWHRLQRQLIAEWLDDYAPAPLAVLAREAVRQARLTTLVRDEFDLAALAEQAALRYLGLLYGYGVQDHALLEDASRAVYRGLQYVAVGQHFETDPLLLPAARQALGRLIACTSQRMDEHQRLQRSPRRHGPPSRRTWPAGVVPWSEQPFSPLGQPALRRRVRPSSPLGGRDRASIAATMLAGTAGNVVSAACLLIDSALDDPTLAAGWGSLASDAALAAALPPALAARPPLPVVPRRIRDPKGVTLKDGTTHLDAGTDCLVLLEALHGQPGCPHAWGEVSFGGATHACLGQALTLPLLVQLVRQVLALPLLRRALDPLTGRPLPLERLWGFGCTRLPLLHDRLDRGPGSPRRRRQNLIVAMRVKSPVAVHAPALKRLIGCAVPRIDQVLRQFGFVEHAWFEFGPGDAELVLRTVYEGDFDSYIRFFAVQAGDLFDSLFEHLEDAPPMPVAEFPDDFIETVRRFNRAPLAGYLFGA